MKTGKIKIEVDGFTWYWEEIDRLDGSLQAVRLYDVEGQLVCEFSSYREMIRYIKGASV